MFERLSRPSPTTAPLNPYLTALAQVREEKRKREEDAARSKAEVSGDEIKERCQTLVGFVREFWPVLEPDTRYVHGYHIDAIAEHLQAVQLGQITRLAINVPPGFMKSLLCSVFFPAHWWGPLGRPGRRYLTSSYEQELALRDAGKMKTLVESPEYQALYGDQVQLLKRGLKRFTNSKGGGRESRAFRSMTGGRGDVVIIDDPHSTETAESDTERAKTVRIFRESIQNRTNDPNLSAIIVIMQRLHSYDVCGAIDALELGYERLVLPMEFEPKRRCVTSIGWRDRRDADGELLFPEKFDAIAVEKLKKLGSYAYAGQYQQRPVPREGGMFQRSWFEGKFINAAPQGTRFVRHWDLAATDLNPAAQTGARTCGVKMGLTPAGEFVVAHMVAAGVGGAKQRKLIKSTTEEDGYSVEVSIPQDPGQAGTIQVRDYIRLLKGYVVRRLLEGQLGNKVDRADPFSAQCEGGNVWLVRGPWNTEYLDEICQFPGGARKDVADASSGAFAKLTGRGGGARASVGKSELVEQDGDDDERLEPVDMAAPPPPQRREPALPKPNGKAAKRIVWG